MTTDEEIESLLQAMAEEMEWEHEQYMKELQGEAIRPPLR